MNQLYSSPLRVYLCLGALALVGIFSGFRLPVSLFPNSSKPVVGMFISYGGSTADEFLNAYGSKLESQLREISTDEVEVEKVTSNYGDSGVDYTVDFRWGTKPKTALREVELAVNSFGGRFPKEIRDNINIWSRNDNAGFLAMSFYSETRSLDDLYDILDPALVPQLSKVGDANNPGLWNPTQKEIRIELKPEVMASLQLLPRDIERAVTSALSPYSGGVVTQGTQRLTVQMPRNLHSIEGLGQSLVSTPSGRAVHLSDVAKIDFGLKTSDSKSFKTNGAPSIILFADPKPGGNVKKMSEDVLEIVRNTMPTLPKDIHYRVLVDPSSFIRAAVNNVFHEVAIGAFLAVGILFLFIGSLRNVATAAIEIPLSMILAFILMKVSGMNLNLISLGGLALSAGMNVDASVVVMENIFRHLDLYRRSHPGPMSAAARLSVIAAAVKEVRFAVIASTIASLVVFLPLAFTSELTNAILGDLAKTVVFSHGLSAAVALVLVPTVRLHLMSKESSTKPESHTSPIEKYLQKIENLYATTLDKFLRNSKIRYSIYGGLAVALVLLAALVIPKLPREVLGTPDTDMMIVSFSTNGNTLTRQMEIQAEEVEADLFKHFGEEIDYTFNQIRGANQATIMARLKNKKQMRDLWKAMEEHFTNTPTLRFWVGPWNPAELPIPDPPQMRIVVRGNDWLKTAAIADDLQSLLNENKVFPRIWTNPNPARSENILLKPHLEQWPALMSSGASFVPADLADLALIATQGRKIGQFSVQGKMTEIMLRYPENIVRTPEELASLPIGVAGKIVPLKALASVNLERVSPSIYREDQRELFVISGRYNELDKNLSQESLLKAKELVRQKFGDNPTSISFEDAEKDLTTALRQLAVAVALSIALIFVTMVLQFGSVVNAALVLVAIPMGFIGVILALFIFQSTLSLNSILGVILLNGLAVANSIILVDFLKRLVDKGVSPREAALQAARTRLRPILITSLTTVLGMLPVALGLGDGGRILQPLGIAVSGGLWFSMGLTLFIVPALQVSWLEFVQFRRSKTPETQVRPPVPSSVISYRQTSEPSPTEYLQ